MRTGVHVSIAGGLDKAFARADKLGCDTFQIFIKNPRGWKARELAAEELARVDNKKEALDLFPVVVHMTYLVNLASPKDELFRKSIAGLGEDYNRAGLIGAEYLVIHPGNHTGSGIEAGVKRIQKGLNKILEGEYQTTILLENVSGGGSKIGKDFAELGAIYEGIQDKERIGLCFDTCHAFAAGYDLRNKEGWQRVLTEIQEYFPLNALKLLHVNDSQGELGSGLDRHEHLGEGKIGDEGFRLLASFPELAKLPMILETPKEDDSDDLKNLQKLRSYLGEG
ncbi:MAG: deoxyribonuclease IV [Halanaerobium sp.]|nr:deoxyribonuclease IV [Halanaerobium sp.]